MFYTTQQLVDAFNQKNNTPTEITMNSIFLKTVHTASPKLFTANIVNFILDSLEKNVADISTITDMLSSVLSSQFSNTNSVFFGLFPYSLSLDESDYITPDYDFQPLVLLPLLKCYIEYQHLLPAELTTQLSEAITLATNIVSYNSNLIDSHNKLLEIILMICVGECLSIPQFANSAVNKANKYYHFIKYNDDMPPEYNSPDIILSQLEAIDAFYMYINNQDIKNVLDNIKNILLSIFYRHFHPHLLQWTGPFAISPSRFITNNTLERISKLTNQKNNNRISIPNEFRHLSPLYENKFEQLLVSRGMVFPHYKQHLVASIYNTRTFSFCSFNHDDLWHRRMPCIGYFGNQKNPYCLYVQCLLNDISFSSASFHSIQHKEVLLGHINFSTNRGYKGISSDNSASYKTTDLRIRFCIEGDISKLKIRQYKNQIKVACNKLNIAFNALYAVFDTNKINYELTTLEDKLYFDVILYNGEETDLALAKIEEAIVAFSVYIGESNKFNFTAKTYQDKDFIYTESSVYGLELKLKSHKKPNNYEVIFSQDGQFISGKNISTYVSDADTFSKHHDFFFENKNNTNAIFLKESNIHNNEILKDISNISKHTLYNVSPEIRKMFKTLDSFTVNETKHYSILILHQLYELATHSDRRFIRLIEQNYADIYQQLRIMLDKKNIKKLIINTANQLKNDYKSLQDTNTSSTVNIIESIVKTIHSDYSNCELSLQNIATNYNVSESYISRKFSEYMGISYVKYLTQVRINRAIDLLNSSSDTTDLHLKCGYYNPQTFETAFKKITGHTLKGFINKYSNNK